MINAQEFFDLQIKFDREWNFKFKLKKSNYWDTVVSYLGALKMGTFVQDFVADTEIYSEVSINKD